MKKAMKNAMKKIMSIALIMVLSASNAAFCATGQSSPSGGAERAPSFNPQGDNMSALLLPLLLGLLANNNNNNNNGGSGGSTFDLSSDSGKMLLSTLDQMVNEMSGNDNPEVKKILDMIKPLLASLHGMSKGQIGEAGMKK
jgi:hypothetical protein